MVQKRRKGHPKTKAHISKCWVCRMKKRARTRWHIWSHTVQFFLCIAAGLVFLGWLVFGSH